jgi:hypothetical protein
MQWIWAKSHNASYLNVIIAGPSLMRGFPAEGG